MKHISNVPNMTQSYYKVVCDFHAKDKEHFTKIKDDIFSVCKCTIFYSDDENPCDEEEWKFSIQNANLYILIVSSHVLTDFDNQHMQTAIQNNVPVLPILIENGIEEIFNEKFDNIQCISTGLELIDCTAVPYIEKLQNFLNQTFLLPFDVDELREAFDGSIFLSYRKKDRQYAQKLMDIIHSDDKLKNISIWYDEFLIPGENFNDSIKSELENSMIFMLMVTPNILEEKNYIKIVEYPIAYSMNKSILPIEMIDTKQEELKKAYPQIPEVVKSSDAAQLKASILEVLAKNDVEILDRTAERDFFIGYAFLKGLYVEKNTAIAVDLITQAAKQDIMLAIQVLVSMYKYGEGCEIDTEQAAFWQEKYICNVRSCFEQNSTKEQAEIVVDAYKELADIYARGRNLDALTEAYDEVIRFLENSGLNDEVFLKANTAELCEQVAKLFINEGSFTRARYAYLNRAIHLRKELYESHSDKRFMLDLILTYLLQARNQSMQDDRIGLKTTILVELKQLRAELLNYASSDEENQKVILALSDIGHYLNELDRPDEAFQFIFKAGVLVEDLDRKYKTINTSILRYEACKNLGEQQMLCEDLRLALAEGTFQEAHRLANSLYERSETLEIRLIVAESYKNLSRIRLVLEKESDLVENIEKAIVLLEQIYEELPARYIKQKLYQCYYLAADIYLKCDDTDKAELFWEKGLKLNREVIHASDLSVYKMELAAALKKKGEYLKEQWDFDEALACFEERHGWILAGACKNSHLFLIAESYESLIPLHKKVGNVFEAKELAAELKQFKENYDYLFNGTVKLYK